MKLEVNNVTCGYGDITIIRGLSFEARAGEVLALLGRNGAGKTTVMRVISGLIHAEEGDIRVGDHEVTSIPPYKRVNHGLAFVQEGKRIFSERTVRENLELGAYSVKLKRAELESRIEQEYERFTILRDKRDLPAGSLSGGQQQMLSISQALMRKPSVLLLDEPSAGLAPTIVGEVFDEIARLRDSGMTVVLVEQAVGWAASVADRIAVLELGTKIYEGSPDGPEAEAAIRRIELGGDSESVVQK